MFLLPHQHVPSAYTDPVPLGPGLGSTQPHHLRPVARTGSRRYHAARHGAREQRLVQSRGKTGRVRSTCLTGGARGGPSALCEGGAAGRLFLARTSRAGIGEKRSNLDRQREVRFSSS